MSTCTAPGHPTCTITCPNGCIALYDEDLNKCRTMCSTAGVFKLNSNSRISIKISEMNIDDLAKILDEKSLVITNDKPMKPRKSISLSLSNVLPAELFAAILKEAQN